MNQAVEDLKKAYDVLDERGWCQNSVTNLDGNVCVAGAIWVAVGVSVTLTGVLRSVDWRRFDDAMEALEAVSPNKMWPSTFNDLDTTTVEDVKLLLKRGIEKAESA